MVQTELSRCGLNDYRCEVKGAYITVYEPRHSRDDYSEMLKEMVFLASAAKDYLASRIEKGPFDPVMRFRLFDGGKRIFDVERMTYRGRGGWMSLHHLGSLSELARDYLGHLGKESFYDLM